MPNRSAGAIRYPAKKRAIPHCSGIALFVYLSPKRGSGFLIVGPLEFNSCWPHDQQWQMARAQHTFDHTAQCPVLETFAPVCSHYDHVTATIHTRASRVFPTFSDLDNGLSYVIA